MMYEINSPASQRNASSSNSPHRNRTRIVIWNCQIEVRHVRKGYERRSGRGNTTSSATNTNEDRSWYKIANADDACRKDSIATLSSRTCFTSFRFRVAESNIGIAPSPSAGSGNTNRNRCRTGCVSVCIDILLVLLGIPIGSDKPV